MSEAIYTWLGRPRSQPDPDEENMSNYARRGITRRCAAYNYILDAALAAAQGWESSSHGPGLDAGDYPASGECVAGILGAFRWR